MKNKKVLIILAIILLLAIVCGFIVVGLTALGINIANPSGALKDSRNTRRQSDVDILASGFKNFVLDSDDYGIFNNIEDCEKGSTVIGKDGLDLEKKFVPDYLVAIPFDPAEGDANNSGYTICGKDDGILEISAPKAEDKEVKTEVNLEELFQEKLNNLNPSNSISDSRDTQRTSDVNQILTAVSQFIAEGNSLDDLGNITICNTGKAKIGTDGVDLAAKLVPTFLVRIPTDPSTGTDADTGYTICKNNKGQISVEAPNAEGSKKIQVLK